VYDADVIDVDNYVFDFFRDGSERYSSEINNSLPKSRRDRNARRCSHVMFNSLCDVDSSSSSGRPTYRRSCAALLACVTEKALDNNEVTFRKITDLPRIAKPSLCFSDNLKIDCRNPTLSELTDLYEMADVTDDEEVRDLFEGKKLVGGVKTPRKPTPPTKPEDVLSAVTSDDLLDVSVETSCRRSEMFELPVWKLCQQLSLSGGSACRRNERNKMERPSLDFYKMLVG